MAITTMSYNATMLSGTNADRTAMTTAQLGSVQYTFFESDTKLTYKWTGSEWLQIGTGGAAHVADFFLDPTGNVKVGNVATPAAAAVTNLFTEVVGSGFTKLVLKFKPLNGYSVANSPGVYYVINSADPATALLVPTACHYLAVGDEVVHTFLSTAPLTNVDVKAVGTTTATLITWEYK